MLYGEPIKIKANGITFRCRIDGEEGAPWLTLSNSLATDLSMWDEQVAVLKKDFRVLRYDQRGHGGTEAPEGRYSFDTLIEDVIAIYDELSIPAAHFLGISMGGMTALGLAQRYTDRVDRLIVCDCTAASTPAGAQQWEERIAVATRDGMEALVDPTIGRWFPPEVIAEDPPVLDRVRKMIRKTPVAGFAGCAAALSNFDFRPGLAAIWKPTLFICGTKDVALGGLKQMHAAVTGSQLVELQGAGHLSNLEQPGPFTRAVAAFLK
jgi:3-oxoadipate enol-lactonase